jgi:Family of unknown function (DUF6390)
MGDSAVPGPTLARDDDGRTRARRAEPSGPLLFARYAYGPNRLGYCGPADATELFELAVDGRREGDLRALARSFDGAWPYLELIARSNGRPDPLDPEVVEAYWLGNGLLDRVPPMHFGTSLEARFRSRLRAEDWRWLAGKPTDGARPVHAFHVLDVFPRVGLLRRDRIDDVLATIDGCRIRWGRVVAVEGDSLIVAVVPVRHTAGRLKLVAPELERVQAWRDGAGFVADVQPGDVISVHWSWACDRLDTRRLSNLIGWTQHHLEVANRTM